MLSVNKRSTLPLNVKIYSLLTTFQWNKSSEIYFPDCITFCASVGRQCRYCLLSDDLCHSVTQTEHARNESSFPSAFLLKCLPHVVVCGRRTFHRFQGLWFPCMLTVCQLSFKSILNAPTHHVHFCHPLPAFLFLLGFICFSILKWFGTHIFLVSCIFMAPRGLLRSPNQLQVIE